jgi:hypothetical protein
MGKKRKFSITLNSLLTDHFEVGFYPYHDDINLSIFNFSARRWAASNFEKSLRENFFSVFLYPKIFMFSTNKNESDHYIKTKYIFVKKVSEEFDNLSKSETSIFKEIDKAFNDKIDSIIFDTINYGVNFYSCMIFYSILTNEWVLFFTGMKEYTPEVSEQFMKVFFCKLFNEKNLIIEKL